MIKLRKRGQTMKKETDRIYKTIRKRGIIG